MRVHQSEYTPANTSTGNSSEQRQVHQCETKAPSEHTGISAETAVHQALVYRANIRNRELVGRHGVLGRQSMASILAMISRAVCVTFSPVPERASARASCASAELKSFHLRRRDRLRA